MYAPRGHGLSEVGDVEVYPEGERLHLFHLTLPNHDAVQHAVSDDGLAWRAVPAALRTGDPGACDDDQIWTMSVTERDGTYFMLYTALSRAEDGMVQRTSLATSDDLVRWTKVSDLPVAEADARWYEADVSASGSVSWRDPKPIKVGDTYFAAVCARERGGPLMRRGCVGLLSSRDLQAWEPRPPLFAPRRYWDLECPQAFKIDGHFYLMAAVMEDRTQRYWSAPSFEGPYTVPADGGILAPRGHYAGRVCRWRGEDLYYCWHKADYDWPGLRNPYGKFVPAPLSLVRRADGSLGRRTFSAWSAYREGALTAPTRMPATLFAEQPATSGDHWRVMAQGMDVLATVEEAEDVWIEGTLALDAVSGGLAFRLDGDGGGYFVELAPGTDDVVLQKWLPWQRADDGRPWFDYRELQRGRLPARLPRGEPVRFQLLVVGPYVECSVGGEVVLATLTAARTRGLFGVWAQSGEATVLDLRSAPMRQPRHQ